MQFSLFWNISLTTVKKQILCQKLSQGCERDDINDLYDFINQQIPNPTII